jgi:diguanylate cyclase (GGDEF)-like protein
MMNNHVGTKLGLAFGVLIAILVGGGFFALRRLDQTNATLLNVLDESWVNLHLAREALVYSSQNSRITMEIFLLSDRRLADPLLAKRAENTQKITELVSKIEKQCDSPEEKRLLAAVQEARAPYVQSYLRALHILLDEHKVEAARSIMIQETTPALFKYHAAWNDFLKFEMDEMDRAAGASKAQYAKTRAFALSMILLAILIAATIAVTVTRKMVVEIGSRVQAEHEARTLNAGLEIKVLERTQELANARDQLRTSLDELQQSTGEIEGVSELLQLLQSCHTTEEAHRQIARVLPRFFPAGALLMLNPSRNLLDSAAVWGSASMMPGPFSPDTCWALRRGSAHLVQPDNFTLLCGHVDPTSQSSHLCVPMVGQGESLGVLYIQNPANSGGMGASQHMQRFAVTLAERMSLALANLMLRETLKYQSVRDPLTGLFNRRHMEESLARELLRADRNRKSLAVFMIDLDRFKQFNDSFGHEAGDILLREVGALFSSQTRGGDIVCRYGGEEFLIILLDANLEVARQRAETLKGQVRNLQVHHRGQTLRQITISIGVAAYPDHGSSAQEMINAADKALYRAKASGRDKVVVADEVSDIDAGQTQPTDAPLRRSGDPVIETSGDRSNLHSALREVKS